MYKVKVIGAGSAGVHLAHACREKNWKVVVIDNSVDAVGRFHGLYEERYGEADYAITLGCMPDATIVQGYDVVMIATPPETHVELAMNVLRRDKARVLLIEKPLSTPQNNQLRELLYMADYRHTRVLVGYNHLLHPDVVGLEVGEGVTFLDIEWKESVKNILAAHPWLESVWDSYLGYTVRGGGCMCEHSHAISLYLHLAERAGWGFPVVVEAWVAMHETYDENVMISLKHKNDAVGWVSMDFVTKPAVKRVVVGDRRVNIGAEKRADDFRYEVDHIEALLDDETLVTPISLYHGVMVMDVIKAALKSEALRREVKTSEILV